MPVQGSLVAKRGGHAAVHAFGAFVASAADGLRVAHHEIRDRSRREWIAVAMRNIGREEHGVASVDPLSFTIEDQLEHSLRNDQIFVCPRRMRIACAIAAPLESQLVERDLAAAAKGKQRSRNESERCECPRRSGAFRRTRASLASEQAHGCGRLHETYVRIPQQIRQWFAFTKRAVPVVRCEGDHVTNGFRGHRATRSDADGRSVGEAARALKE